MGRSESRGRRSRLVWLPRLTLAVMIGPVVVGLAGTVLPAFGFLPALGGTKLGLGPWRELFATPGIWASVRLSFVTGLVATALALGLTLSFCAALQGTRAFGLLQRALAPLLAVPHAAAALGFAFLIAPSGWTVRAFSPWLTGWRQPPDVLVVHDPAGIALVVGLAIKEAPFLLLMTLAALAQADATRARTVALGLGYGPLAAWFKAVLPRVYPQIRLPVYAVLAFSMSVVEVAAILGPTTPPTLAVRIVQWTSDADLASRFPAAAGALLQCLLVVATLLLWRLGEVVVAGLGRRFIEAGGRFARDVSLRLTAVVLAAIMALAAFLGLAGLALWSVAGLWPFPQAFPSGLSMRVWVREAPVLTDVSRTTLAIGAVSAAAALALTLGCLEAEERLGRHPRVGALWLLYVPLLVPQVGFLFGLQIAAITTGFDRNLAVVALAHLVFVLPYVFLTLAGPFRTWDRRFATAAAALGASPNGIFWQVRLPMLLGPILTALAVGFAVSVGQYLPTLLLGGGRVRTLTTEAVALASGGDRRIIGAYALLQMLASMLGFTLARAIPALLYRRRRSMLAEP